MRNTFVFLLLLLFHTASGFSETAKRPPLSMYEKERRYLLEIGQDIIGRECLVFGRVVESKNIPLGSVRESAFPGNVIINNVIRITKEGESIMLRVINYPSSSPTSLTSTQPSDIPVSQLRYPLVAANKTAKTYTIDISFLLNHHNRLLYLHENKQRDFFGNDSLALSTSVKYIKNLSSGIELGWTKTYEGGKELFLNTSIILLDKDPMPVRYKSPYNNYFPQELMGDAQERSAILRWKIEPKKDDVKKYLAGKLVEPQKQIVYYISRNTPGKWRPYIKQAVLDWNDAFEKIGFKNVMAVKDLPDSIGFEYQSAQSTIHYIESTMESGTYSLAVDPRSGEVLQSHIFFTSETEKQIDRNYIFQMLLTDTRASFSGISNSIKGELIRRMITHEVGHSLGFDHNHYASAAVDVEDYRNKAAMRENGLTPSIMDYARYNYIAQPGDGIDFDEGLIYSIGKYDEWALKWGYTYFNDQLSQAEQQVYLDKLLKLRDQSPVYFYLPTENDCRATAESLGNDHTKASRYGMANLEKIAMRFNQQVERLDSARKSQLYVGLFFTYAGYIEHTLVDLVNPLYSIDAAGRKTYHFLPAPFQSRAIAFLAEYGFRLPAWYYEALNHLDSDSLKNKHLENMAFKIAATVLFQENIMAMTEGAHFSHGDTVFALIRNELFKPEKDSLNAAYRKLLQSTYVRRMKRMETWFDSGSNAAKLLKREISLLDSVMLANNSN